MKGIEEGGSDGKSRGIPTATLVALLSALAILAVLVIVAIRIFPRNPTQPPKPTVEALLLSRGELLNEAAVARFDLPRPTAEVRQGWATIGKLTLVNTRGLHPELLVSTTAPAESTDVGGGGIVTQAPIPPDEPFAAVAELRIGKPSESTLVEFFVSTDPNFSPDRATSTNDLVWLLRGPLQKVLLNGREQSSNPRPEPPKADGDGAAGVPVSILMNRDMAVVECNGQRLWAGPHGLPPAPRYVGVRFLCTGPKGRDPAELLSVRVMKK